MSEINFYRCEKCGNIVALLRKGGGTLTCCGQAMTLLKANTSDGAAEKHVPVVTRKNGKLKVQIGSVPHPMLPEHHIEWIALVSGDRLEFKYLHPGEQPTAEFDDAKTGVVYEYCNLHGLWKAEF